MNSSRSKFNPDWPVFRVGNVCRSVVPGRNKPSRFDGEIPWITIADLESFYIQCSRLELAVSKRTIDECGGKILPKNSVIMSCVGQFGIVGIADTDIVINQQLHAYVCPPELSPYFLACVLTIQKPFMERIATKTTISYMNKASCNSVPIPLPPIAEQRKIAEILGAWDEAITLTERLIEAKQKRKKGLMQKRKKGLMQQLLTGKVRFPGFESGNEWVESKIGRFPADWEIFSLARVTDIAFSNVDKKSKAGEVPVRLCNYMDVFKNDYIRSDMPFMQATATEREIKRFTLQKNDVIITKDSETSEEIAEPTVVIEDLDNVICGYHLAVLRPKSIINGVFLKNMLSEPAVHHQFVKKANGITRFGLTQPTVKQALIPIPPLEEQEKIASVLTSCDDEIDLLQRKVAALREQKKGLMQQLLTGKVRVKV